MPYIFVSLDLLLDLYVEPSLSLQCSVTPCLYKDTAIMLYTTLAVLVSIAIHNRVSSWS